MLFRAWDVRFAVATFAIVEWFAETHSRLRATPHLLDISIGLSVAVLAVVLAALSILVAFLNEDYAQLLAASRPGVAGAIRPYVETSVISGVTAALSIAGLFFWPIAPPWGRSLILAASVGMSVWAVIGTVELVGITARHGRLRARLPEIEKAYRDAKGKKAS